MSRLTSRRWKQFDALREQLTIAGTVFALARVKQDLLARLQAFGLASKIGADLLFPTLPTAVEAYEKWARDHPLPPRQDDPGDS